MKYQMQKAFIGGLVIASLAVTPAFLPSTAPSTVSAEENGEETDIDQPSKVVKTYDLTAASEFTIDPLTGALISYTGSKEISEIVIPYKIQGTVVTSLGTEVFADCQNLHTIVLPDSVVEIGEKAFAQDGALHTLLSYSPSQLIESSLQEGDSIPDSAVIYTDSDELPNDLSGLHLIFSEDDDYAEYCICLPDELTTLAKDAFLLCRSISKFYISEGNESFWTGDAAHYSAPDAVSETTAGELLLDHSMTTLYRLAPAFHGDNYEIPEGIKIIDDYSCSYCDVNNGFVIPASAVKIGNYAFYGCTNQHSFRFADPSSVTEIGDYAFAYTVNLNITLPKSVTSIGEYCFAYTQNMNADISHSSITTIPSYAFAYSPTLHELTAPSTLTSVKSYAFTGSTNLDTVHFTGNSLTELGTGVFEGCSTLHEIEIPEGVTALENDTFSGCTNLGTIILPESLKSIGDNTFKDCRTIETLVIPAGVTTISKSSFTGAKTDKIDASKNATASKLLNRTTASSSVKEPKKGTTFSNGNLKYMITSTGKNRSVTVKGAVSKKKLKKLKLKAKVSYKVKGKTYKYKITAIGKKAFAKCKKLKSVSLSKNVTSISAKAFNGCSSLQKIKLSSSKIKTFGKKSFSGISKKASITIPKKKSAAYQKKLKKAGLPSSAHFKVK